MIDAVCSVTWPVPCCIGNFLFFFGKSDIWNMCLFWVQNRSSILFRYAMEDLLRALAILILLRCGNGFLLPKIQHSWFLKNRDSKKQTQKAWLSDIAIFSCSNSLRLPVKYDTTSKNTVAHSTFEHLEHHNISKIVILPHKSHVSHKYKCMNDGFLINQHADQKNFVRAEHNSM